MKYRKLPGNLHQWHNQPPCPEWPDSGFMEHDAPEEKTICSNCASITKLGAKAAEPSKEPKKK